MNTSSKLAWAVIIFFIVCLYFLGKVLDPDMFWKVFSGSWKVFGG